MSRMTPDGAKIAQIRKDRELSQQALAHDARMSERLLREIERQNKAVRQTMLLNLATALGRPLDDLVLKDPSSEPKSFDLDALFPPPLPPDQLRLELVTDGREFSSWAQDAATFTWAVDDIQVDKGAAALMEEVLKLVLRWVNRGVRRSDGEKKKDEYDAEHVVPALFRLARLNELLTELTDRGIAMMANRYVYRVDTGQELHKLFVGFSPVGMPRRTVRIDPGVLPQPETERSDDLDEDIPF